MRVTGLFALCFFCLVSFALVSVCAAPASDQGLVSAGSFDKRYGILRNDPDSAADSLDTPAQRYFARVKQEEDGVCYKLRSYKVARDDRDSDSTHPVGYSTCQRASKFQMRSADEVVLPETK